MADPPVYKLGLKLAGPKPQLLFGTYFKSPDLPLVPTRFGRPWLIAPGAWGILGNDNAGDCVWAGAAHETMMFSADAGGSVDFNTAGVLSDYSAVTRYVVGDDASDQGTDMTEAAAYRQKTGIVDSSGQRHKIDVYADIRVADLNQLALATYLLGAVGVGVEFTDVAMDQFNNGDVWDVKKGAKQVGGHYIPCLLGSTRIPLLCGRSETIEEMAASPERERWVYSTDQYGNIVPGRVRKPMLTARRRELIRVILDNGESFSCTSGHLIMRRDGSYVEAGALEAGVSLMPLYRRTNNFSYEEIFNPYSQSWRLTHRQIKGPTRRRHVVHHADFNKRNNDPTNLIEMTWDEHTALHAAQTDLLSGYAKSEIGRQRSRELMLKNWDSPAFRARHAAHLASNEKIAAHRLKASEWGPDTETRRRSGSLTGPVNILLAHSPEGRAANGRSRKLLFANDPSFRAKLQRIAIQNGMKAAKLTLAQAITIRERVKNGEAQAGLADEFGVSRPQVSRIVNEKAWNHCVLKVEDAGRGDVFDLEVERYHNFALDCGVFVHNCIGRNSANNFLFVSWGRLQAATPAWVRRQMDSGIAYLSRERLSAQGLSPQGFDLAQLNDDLSQITRMP